MEFPESGTENKDQEESGTENIDTEENVPENRDVQDEKGIMASIKSLFSINKTKKEKDLIEDKELGADNTGKEEKRT